MSNELPGLTGLRGYAALCVVFLHYRIPGFGLGWLAVDIFFVLSGFILSHVYRDGLPRSEFLWARFARTWPTHAVASAAVGAAMITYQVIPGRGMNDLAMNLLLLGILNPPTWSLIVEWYAYLLMAALLPLPAARRVPGWVLLLAGSAVGLIGVWQGGGYQIAFHWSHLARGLGWFAVGIGLYRTGWQPARTWLFDNRLALWLGAISYPLYLVHALPAVVLEYGDHAPLFVVQTVGIPASILLASALHYAVEMPARRWLRSLSGPIVQALGRPEDWGDVDQRRSS